MWLRYGGLVAESYALQENSELRRQTEEAQERSTAAERRQQAEQHKQVRKRFSSSTMPLLCSKCLQSGDIAVSLSVPIIPLLAASAKVRY